MTWSLLPWLVVSGGIGALVRYLVSVALPPSTNRRIPPGVLAVNVFGSLLAGITLGLVQCNVIGSDAALIVWAGLCGGLTTFSTVALDTMTLIGRRVAGAWLNVGVTVVSGCASAALGFAIVRALCG